MECGELTVFGALGIKEVFLVSVSFCAEFSSSIRIWLCLPSLCGPFGTKGTR